MNFCLTYRHIIWLASKRVRHNAILGTKTAWKITYYCVGAPNEFHLDAKVMKCMKCMGCIVVCCLPIHRMTRANTHHGLQTSDWMNRCRIKYTTSVSTDANKFLLFTKYSDYKVLFSNYSYAEVVLMQQNVCAYQHLNDSAAKAD